MSNVDPRTALQPAQSFSLSSDGKATISLGSGVTFWAVESDTTSVGTVHYLASETQADVDTPANTHRVRPGLDSGWIPSTDRTIQLKAVGGAATGRVRAIKVT